MLYLPFGAVMEWQPTTTQAAASFPHETTQSELQGRYLAQALETLCAQWSPTGAVARGFEIAYTLPWCVCSRFNLTAPSDDHTFIVLFVNVYEPTHKAVKIWLYHCVVAVFPKILRS
jgi:hypothetical protein